MKDCCAIIIAGGKGTRLSEYTIEIPKPMIPINGKPVLEYQIEEFASYGITHIYITVSYLKEVIMSYFADGKKWGVDIEYIIEENSLGTCGAFYFLKEKIKLPMFIVYGDVLFSMDLNKIREFHNYCNADITLVAHPNSHPYDSDLIISNEYNCVEKIDKKEKSQERMFYHNLINAGLFYANVNIFTFFSKPEKKDFEKDLVNFFVERKKVYAYKTSEYIKDMGTYQRLEEVAKSIKTGILETKNLRNKQKCVFLDRDGTLNKLCGLINDYSKMELEIGVGQAVKMLNSAGYLCIVITNQPVIARNLCSIEELDAINMKLETLLGAEGAYIDDLYYCPHHPDSGYPEERREYKVICECRKPKTALVDRAIKQYNIDRQSSYFIGDTTVDIQTGKNAKIHTILLKTGAGGLDGKYNIEPDMVCDNLLQAAEVIVNGLYK